MAFCKRSGKSYCMLLYGCQMYQLANKRLTYGMVKVCLQADGITTSVCLRKGGAYTEKIFDYNLWLTHYFTQLSFKHFNIYFPSGARCAIICIVLYGMFTTCAVVLLFSVS